MVGMIRGSRRDTRSSRSRSFAVAITLLSHAVVTCYVSCNIRADDDSPSETANVGTFDGRPITFSGPASDIGDEELKRLFVGPVWETFLSDHKDEVVPRDEEIDAFIAFEKADVDRQRESLEQKLRKIEQQINTAQERGLSQEKLKAERSWIVHRLKPMSRHTAAFQIEHWKAFRLLYDTHGKGDVVFQQLGVEPIDALHALVSRAIREERLVIRDKALRERVLQYYPRVKKTSLVLSRDDLDSLFLAPGWTQSVRAKSLPGKRRADSGREHDEKK
jgi:hypothetical protein